MPKTSSSPRISEAERALTAGRSATASLGSLLAPRMPPPSCRIVPLLEVAQASTHRRFELRSVHHQIEETLLEQELAALESFGQRLADGLLDHASPGEADQGAWLGDVDVAEHGERRHH